MSSSPSTPSNSSMYLQREQSRAEASTDEEHLNQQRWIAHFAVVGDGNTGAATRSAITASVELRAGVVGGFIPAAEVT
jgi:hypothetical protein